MATTNKDVNLALTKLNRSLRFLKKSTDEASELLDSEAETNADIESAIAQIGIVSSTIDDEVRNVERLNDAFECVAMQTDSGPTQNQTDLVDSTAESVFDAKRLLKRLQALKLKLQKKQDTHDPIFRSVSQNSVRMTDRRGVCDDADVSGSVASTQQSDYANEPEDHNVNDMYASDVQQQFGVASPENVSRVPSADGVNVSMNVNSAAAVAAANGSVASMSDETIRMLCQTVMQLSANQQQTQGKSTTHLKLPKHDLLKFSKGPENWATFWDQFVKAVDERPNLAAVEKMQYLKGCLEGDAAKLVKGLPLSNDNYSVAVGLLKNRFGNPNTAIEKIYAKLVDLPVVPPRDCNKLRDFCFDLENSLRQLEALGADSKSDHLVGVVLRKLPRYLVTQLERAKGSRQQWSMQILRELLTEELEVAEAAQMRQEPPESEDKKQRDEKSRQSHKSGPRMTTGGFKADDHKGGKKPNSYGAGGQQNKKPKCFFCSAEHWSNDCQKYPTAEKRREFVKNARACFLCFKNDHAARDCRSEKACFHCKKVRMHHASLCPDKYSEGAIARESGRQVGEVEDYTDRQGEMSGLANDEHAVMKTVICEVENPDDSSISIGNVRAFLDTGTSRSWITAAKARELKLKLSRKRRLLINRFADEGEPKSIETQEAKIIIKTRTGQKIKIAVSVTPKALGSVTLASMSEISRHIPTGLVLADKVQKRDEKVEIDMMIGNDYYDDLVYCDRFRLLPGLWLINSAFGWIVSGRVCSQTGRSSENGMFVLPSSNAGTLEFSDEADIVQAVRSKEFRIEDLWNLETIGIKDEPNDITDDIAIEQFNNTVKFEDGRYQVTWPYMQNAALLPKNDDVAFARSKSMLARLQKMQKFDFLEKYDAIIQDQSANGVIEEVPPDESDCEYRVHYLAHHGVEKQDSATTKIRVVYNASYRRNADTPSLNDCLYRGQVFMENLIVLLIRFRLHPVAVIGDLEKAFLKVGLQPNERDVTRFYWVRDIKKPVTAENLVTYRFTRVSFGVKSSPFLLGATVAFHLKQQKTEIARQIEQDLYVDNLVTGVNDAKEAEELYSESKKIFHAANMNMRDFGSNDAEFSGKIPEKDKADRNPVKVLGMNWDKEKDTFASRSCPGKDVKFWTEKQILSALFQVYDPLGLIGPVILPGKVLLQKLNKKGLHWDEQIPKDLEAAWLKIASELAEIDDVRVQIFLGFRLEECQRLMVFCDASADAYAAAVYMQQTDGDQPKSHLIFAKSRVSPLKKMTIPRLELMAVVLGVRMVKFLKQHLPYSGKTIIWSDSQCVLRWIPDKTVTGVFNKNRLQEIRKAENVEFRFVPTNENAADIASRGGAIADLKELWWHGPSWCTKPEADWPQWIGNVDSAALRSTQADEHAEDSGMRLTEANIAPFEINLQNYSSYQRLVHVTVYCNRFVSALKAEKAQDVRLKPSEMRNAAMMWIKSEQSAEFPDLMRDMKSGKRNSMQQQLGIKIDAEGILRCHGRLSTMNSGDETKFPILLPSKSKFTELVIEHNHKQSMHAGTAQTLAAVRQQFWIPRGRERVKNVLKRCSTCLRCEGKAFARPEMPELPDFRTNRSRPFCNIGLDYFGPLYTKSETEEEQKRWVCIVTCLATRAVHLEMVNDLSADEFSMALRRFMARRGKCEVIISDNATQFKAVEKSKVISDTLIGKSISWNFIPEMAPWAGGVYERLIKSVKSAMRKSLGKVTLKDMQLQTVLTEIENCVNSRPLTYVVDDIDSWRVLTPNDFLSVPPQVTIPSKFRESDDPDFGNEFPNKRAEMIKMYKAQLNRLEDLWNIWQNDYLLSLRERMHYKHKDPPGSIERIPRIGEVVVVRDEKTPRGRWKTGQVLEHKVSPDGKIRAVKIKLSAGQILVRPVNFLHPLEIVADDRDTQDLGDEPDTTKERPKRQAAIKAKKQIRDIQRYEDDEETAMSIVRHTVIEVAKYNKNSMSVVRYTVDIGNIYYKET